MTGDSSFVEEMFNEFARYQEGSASALHETEVELEGDDMEVMIPRRGPRLPSEMVYGRCTYDERTDNERMDDEP